jgi:hypothetical protein
VGLASSASILLAGCTNTMAVPRSLQDDDVQELAATAVEIRDGWTPEGDYFVSPRIDAVEGASRVGVLLGTLAAGAMPLVEARLFDHGEPVSDWTPMRVTWSEEEVHVAVVDFAGTGDAAVLRIRQSDLESIVSIRSNAVIPDRAVSDDGPLSSLADGEIGAAREAIRAELRGLGIVTREEWGARPTRCTSGDATKRRFAIHHTVSGSSDPARQLRGIQNYHMSTLGWCDVGYHFLIGSDGRVYEGRPLHLLGAHVADHNSGNIGISFIGCYHTSGCSGLGPSTPSSAMVDVAGRLLGTLSRLYGISLSSTTVKGHRDYPGASTTCPGNNLAPRIPDMISIGRSRTLGSSSSPAPSPSTPAPSPSAGSCRHTYGGTYGDRACSASYQCCSGSWRTRGACGACACVESTGERGCTAGSGPSTPAPPAGAACTHSYGGRYANTACSASYQCCNGSWKTRGGCGSCFCVETTGERGCGL